MSASRENGKKSELKKRLESMPARFTSKANKSLSKLFSTQKKANKDSAKTKMVESEDSKTTTKREKNGAKSLEMKAFAEQVRKTLRLGVVEGKRTTNGRLREVTRKIDKATLKTVDTSIQDLPVPAHCAASIDEFVEFAKTFSCGEQSLKDFSDCETVHEKLKYWANRMAASEGPKKSAKTFGPSQLTIDRLRQVFEVSKWALVKENSTEYVVIQLEVEKDICGVEPICETFPICDESTDFRTSLDNSVYEKRMDYAVMNLYREPPERHSPETLIRQWFGGEQVQAESAENIESVQEIEEESVVGEEKVSSESVKSSRDLSSTVSVKPDEDVLADDEEEDEQEDQDVDNEKIHVLEESSFSDEEWKYLGFYYFFKKDLGPLRPNPNTLALALNLSTTMTPRLVYRTHHQTTVSYGIPEPVRLSFRGTLDSRLASNFGRFNFRTVEEETDGLRPSAPADELEAKKRLEAYLDLNTLANSKIAEVVKAKKLVYDEAKSTALRNQADLPDPVYFVGSYDIDLNADWDRSTNDDYISGVLSSDFAQNGLVWWDGRPFALDVEEKRIRSLFFGRFERRRLDLAELFWDEGSDEDDFIWGELGQEDSDGEESEFEDEIEEISTANEPVFEEYDFDAEARFEARSVFALTIPEQVFDWIPNGFLDRIKRREVEDVVRVEQKICGLDEFVEKRVGEVIGFFRQICVRNAGDYCCGGIRGRDEDEFGEKPAIDGFLWDSLTRDLMIGVFGDDFGDDRQQSDCGDLLFEPTTDSCVGLPQSANNLQARECLVKMKKIEAFLDEFGIVKCDRFDDLVAIDKSERDEVANDSDNDDDGEIVRGPISRRTMKLKVLQSNQEVVVEPPKTSVDAVPVFENENERWKWIVGDQPREKFQYMLTDCPEDEKKKKKEEKSIVDLENLNLLGPMPNYPKYNHLLLYPELSAKLAGLFGDESDLLWKMKFTSKMLRNKPYFANKRICAGDSVEVRGADSEYETDSDDPKSENDESDEDIDIGQNEFAKCSEYERLEDDPLFKEIDGMIERGKGFRGRSVKPTVFGDSVWMEVDFLQSESVAAKLNERRRRSSAVAKYDPTISKGIGKTLKIERQRPLTTEENLRLTGEVQRLERVLFAMKSAQQSYDVVNYDFPFKKEYNALVVLPVYKLSNTTSEDGPVTFIRWHPLFLDLIGCVCVKVEGMCSCESAINMYNLRNSQRPLRRLVIPNRITCFAFNPRSVDQVCVGFYDGSIRFYECSAMIDGQTDPRLIGDCRPKIHNDRIIHIEWTDQCLELNGEKTDVIYSIANDSFVCKTILRNNQTVIHYLDVDLSNHSRIPKLLSLDEKYADNDNINEPSCLSICIRFVRNTIFYVTATTSGEIFKINTIDARKVIGVLQVSEPSIRIADFDISQFNSDIVAVATGDHFVHLWNWSTCKRIHSIYCVGEISRIWWSTYCSAHLFVTEHSGALIAHDFNFHPSAAASRSNLLEWPTVTAMSDYHGLFACGTMKGEISVYRFSKNFAENPITPSNIEKIALSQGKDVAEKERQKICLDFFEQTHFMKRKMIDYVREQQGRLDNFEYSKTREFHHNARISALERELLHLLKRKRIFVK